MLTYTAILWTKWEIFADLAATNAVNLMINNRWNAEASDNALLIKNILESKILFKWEALVHFLEY